uniref:Uncharacterized protein n=1 Tax=Trichobilharzia regenti TaxID=157069 RepID=A0AA85J859_TRIRE|nr:unnamed protein product [Trichobilharzia regenti]
MSSVTGEVTTRRPTGHYSSEDNDDVWRTSEMPVRHTQTERETESKRKTEAQTETETETEKTQSSAFPSTHSMSSVTGEVTTRRPTGHYSSEDNDDVWRTSEMPVRHTQTERETESKRKTEAQTETETETEKTQSSAFPSTHSMSSVTGEVTTRRPTVVRFKIPIGKTDEGIIIYRDYYPEMPIPWMMSLCHTRSQTETLTETVTETKTKTTQSSAFPSTHSMSTVTGGKATSQPTVIRRKRPLSITHDGYISYYHNYADESNSTEMPVRHTQKQTETETETETTTESETETETKTTQSSAFPSTHSMSTVTDEETTRRPTVIRRKRPLSITHDGYISYYHNYADESNSTEMPVRHTQKQTETETETETTTESETETETKTTQSSAFPSTHSMSTVTDEETTRRPTVIRRKRPLSITHDGYISYYHNYADESNSTEMPVRHTQKQTETETETETTTESETETETKTTQSSAFPSTHSMSTVTDEETTRRPTVIRRKRPLSITHDGYISYYHNYADESNSTEMPVRHTQKQTETETETTTESETETETKTTQSSAFPSTHSMSTVTDEETTRRPTVIRRKRPLSITHDGYISYYHNYADESNSTEMPVRHTQKQTETETETETTTESETETETKTTQSSAFPSTHSMSTVTDEETTRRPTVIRRKRPLSITHDGYISYYHNYADESNSTEMPVRHTQKQTETETETETTTESETETETKTTQSSAFPSTHSMSTVTDEETTRRPTVIRRKRPLSITHDGYISYYHNYADESNSTEMPVRHTQKQTETETETETTTESETETETKTTQSSAFPSTHSMSTVTDEETTRRPTVIRRKRPLSITHDGYISYYHNYADESNSTEMPVRHTQKQTETETETETTTESETETETKTTQSSAFPSTHSMSTVTDEETTRRPTVIRRKRPLSITHDGYISYYHNYADESNSTEMPVRHTQKQTETETETETTTESETETETKTTQSSAFPSTHSMSTVTDEETTRRPTVIRRKRPLSITHDGYISYYHNYADESNSTEMPVRHTQKQTETETETETTTESETETETKTTQSSAFPSTHSMSTVTDEETTRRPTVIRRKRPLSITHDGYISYYHNYADESNSTEMPVRHTQKQTETETETETTTESETETETKTTQSSAFPSTHSMSTVTDEETTRRPTVIRRKRPLSITHDGYISYYHNYADESNSTEMPVRHTQKQTETETETTTESETETETKTTQSSAFPSTHSMSTVTDEETTRRPTVIRRKRPLSITHDGYISYYHNYADESNSTEMPVRHTQKQTETETETETTTESETETETKTTQSSAFPSTHSMSTVTDEETTRRPTVIRRKRPLSITHDGYISYYHNYADESNSTEMPVRHTQKQTETETETETTTESETETETKTTQSSAFPSTHSMSTVTDEETTRRPTVIRRKRPLSITHDGYISYYHNYADESNSTEMPVRHTQKQTETETETETTTESETETETKTTQSSAFPSTHSMSTVTDEETTRRPTVIRRKRPLSITHDGYISYYHNYADESNSTEMPVRHTQKQTETETETETTTESETETETKTTQSSAFPSTHSMSTVTDEETTRRPTVIRRKRPLSITHDGYISYYHNYADESNSTEMPVRHTQKQTETETETETTTESETETETKTTQSSAFPSTHSMSTVTDEETTRRPTVVRFKIPIGKTDDGIIIYKDYYPEMPIPWMMSLCHTRSQTETLTETVTETENKQSSAFPSTHSMSTVTSGKTTSRPTDNSTSD